MKSLNLRALAGAVLDHGLNRPIGNHLITSYTTEAHPSTDGRPENHAQAGARAWPRWYQHGGVIIDLDAPITSQGWEVRNV